MRSTGVDIQTPIANQATKAKNARNLSRWVPASMNERTASDNYLSAGRLKGYDIIGNELCFVMKGFYRRQQTPWNTVKP